MGGAWLPETGTCADTCEEQAGDVLCVESVCPVDAPDGPATATTCEECILVGGGWDGVGCSEECEGDDCATTQCPDGSG
jgi:hypothetical protein